MVNLLLLRGVVLSLAGWGLIVKGSIGLVLTELMRNCLGIVSRIRSNRFLNWTIPNYLFFNYQSLYILSTFYVLRAMKEIHRGPGQLVSPRCPFRSPHYWSVKNGLKKFDGRSIR